MRYTPTLLLPPSLLNDPPDLDESELFQKVQDLVATVTKLIDVSLFPIPSDFEIWNCLLAQPNPDACDIDAICTLPTETKFKKLN